VIAGSIMSNLVLFGAQLEDADAFALPKDRLRRIHLRWSDPPHTQITLAFVRSE